MHWFYLTGAGLLEIVWAFFMKRSDSFSRLTESAMRTLPLGTAYTIWTGIGAVGAFLVGIAVLGEAVSALRIVAALLIVAGLVLMKVASPQ